MSSNNKTTGKAATSGRVRKKKKKVTTGNSTSQKSSPTSKSIDRQLINSSINSVVNSFNNSSDNESSGCSLTACKTPSQLPIDNNQQLNHHNQINNQQNQPNQLNQPNQQNQPNSTNLVSCDNQSHLTDNFNGQYLNSSSSSYYTPSFPYNKQQFNSNNNLDNLNNLNNSLNNYLPAGNIQQPNHKQSFLKDKTINKFDRTMMDCKVVNQNSQIFNQNSSSQLNLNTSGTVNIGTYNGKLPSCCGCGKTILDRFLLQTMNSLWHEDCLKVIKSSNF